MSDPEGCEFPRNNPPDKEIADLLKSAVTIAVVGLSPNPSRPSHEVARYLQSNGYRIIPVNPGHPEILGEPCFKSLEEISEEVDVVDIFRQPEAVPEIVDQAIAMKAKAIWMQEGIVNNAAADKARAAGLFVVMNKCMLKEHANLL